jgi:thymidine phosphorylase
LLPVGVRVRKGEPIARVHAAGSEAAEAAAATLINAFSIADRALEAPPLIERID